MSERIQLIRLGAILGGHGLQGEVRVRYFGDSPENIALVKSFSLGDEEDSTQWVVEACRGGARANEVLVQLAGVEDRDAADALKGKEVYGDIQALTPLPEGEYYWYQLVGCRVEDLEGRALGVVQSLWDAGGHDLLVLEDDLLIPTSREVLKEIDLAQQLLRVEVLPGMLEKKATQVEESDAASTTGAEKKKRRPTGAARKRHKKRAAEEK